MEPTNLIGDVCPVCNAANQSAVIETRCVGGNSANRRRRECLRCKERFTTYEIRKDVFGGLDGSAALKADQAILLALVPVLRVILSETTFRKVRPLLMSLGTENTNDVENTNEVG